METAARLGKDAAENMTGTAMLSSFKGEERVTMVVKTTNIQELYVEAMAVGEV